MVFMGQVYFGYWKSIAGQDLKFNNKGGFWAANSGITTYVFTKHPASQGITNDYFENVGKF